jgi:alanine racemase
VKSDRLRHLRPAHACVDLDRLRANYLAVKAACPVPVMPVLKADAYGHGAVAVGLALEPLDPPMLAVAYPEEGVLLRDAGVTRPVLVLSAFGDGQADVILDRALIPVISTPRTLDAFLATARARGARVAVHLKIDTGMTRLGFTPGEAVAAARRLLASGVVEIEGLMTHLASADEDVAATEAQLDRFDETLDALRREGVRPRLVHAANSAGIARLRPSHTAARSGMFIYGLRPRPLAPDIDVRPAMTVSAEIARVLEVPAGTAVSYGGRWVAKRPSRIATIPFGYADGVPRTDAMRERGYFDVQGRRAPVVGNVCMDLTMADLTGHPADAESAEAVLFGDEPTAWDVADWAGTNAWQVLTAVGRRLPRVYVEGGRVVNVDSRSS